jgi:hypothetical protein
VRIRTEFTLARQRERRKDRIAAVEGRGSRLESNASVSMPLKRLLNENRTFDPKAVAILLEAYDGAVAELGLITLAEKEEAAKIILHLALSQTELDATTLRAGAGALLMRSEGPAVRSPIADGSFATG